MTIEDALLFIPKLAEKRYTPEELDALRSFFLTAEQEEAERFLDAWYKAVPDADDGTGLYSHIMKRLEQHRPESKKKPGIFTLNRMIAAVLLLIIAAGAYKWLTVAVKSDSTQVQQADRTPVPAADIRPGGNKAVLTLANGSQMLLDSTRTGLLAEQGATRVLQPNSGLLSYVTSNPTSSPRAVAGFNTVTTPRGGQYQVVLPDGSKVYMNAASSLYFPTAFNTSREVTLTGEAYFEITEDKSRPFKVMVNGIKVEVLGTEFNINAYSDEAAIKTTLLKGAVKVTANDKKVTLFPGEQLSVKGNHLLTSKKVNVEQEIAWKNGLFIFNEVPIEPIMRQLARWYSLDVVYEGKVSDLFVVTIPRSASVGQILEVLELTKGVHFKINGNSITVSE